MAVRSLGHVAENGQALTGVCRKATWVVVLAAATLRLLHLQLHQHLRQHLILLVLQKDLLLVVDDVVVVIFAATLIETV